MSIFEDRFHLGPSDFTDVLETALSRGGDFAELFFEYRLRHSILIEEQIIKETAESVGLGLGIRVWSGDQTGFGYTNDLSPERMKKAARSAAAIAVAGGTPSPPAAFVSRSPWPAFTPSPNRPFPPTWAERSPWSGKRTRRPWRFRRRSKKPRPPGATTSSIF
jgi:Predicted Zn-dependent proteases and their inactivated homologs